MRWGIVIFILFKIVFCISGQVYEPGIPESFLIKTKKTPVIPTKDLENIHPLELQKNDSILGIKNRYGIVSNVQIDIKKEGVSQFLEGRGTIWQYRIYTDNAYALGISFGVFLIPDEAKVFIYNESHTQILGAFTKQNNNPQSFLEIADLVDHSAIIEYFEPIQPEFSGELIIDAVTQAYRNISYNTESTASARIGINCPLGSDYQNQKHAVCRMIYRDTESAYYCTGSFINNTLNDGTPYFITANHCINTSLNAATLVLYFNYENSTCSATDAKNNQTISGGIIVANNQYSDFSLVKMNNVPPDSYNTYYLGWNISDGYSPYAGCIHHPSGTPKCISVDNNSPVSFAGRIKWDDGYLSDPYTHWQITFDQGGTEGGSSGSPLLDNNKRFIGQLHGGDEIDSYYGKASISWNNSSISSQQLKYWLDPIQSGKSYINGIYMNQKPQSEFKCKFQNICIGDQVQLMDQSSYAPQKWKWRISPRSYQFVNGTDSIDKNPYIAFDTAGLYTVTLITQNNYGSDTLEKINFFSAVDHVNVSMANIPSDSTICGYKLNLYKISASGALNYYYSIEKSDKFISTLNNNEMVLSLTDLALRNGSFHTKIKVTGYTGSCKSLDSLTLKVIIPVNDKLINALQIGDGISPVYNNICASFDNNEPYPPLNCALEKSWCPQTALNADSVLNGTLWYKFVGPSNGKINIRVTGSDNRIAVYETKDMDVDIDSATTLIPELKLVAANDNYSSTDNTAFIKNLTLQSGKRYWLQLDSDTKTPGYFNIFMWSGSVEIRPNISDGIFSMIISAEKEGMADIQVFTDQGRMVYSSHCYVTANENSISSDKLPYLAPGFYLVKVSINGNLFKSKFIIIK